MFGLGELFSFNNLNGPVQFGYDVYNTERNYHYMRQNFQYQKDLQNRIFAREDNAVQRRVKDLKAANMNPLLAAGGAASSGAAVTTTAPQHSGIDLLARTKAATDISMTKAQQNLINSQQGLINEQRTQQKKQNELTQLTLDWYRNNPGFAPGVESGVYTGKGISSILGAVSNRISPASLQRTYERNNPKREYKSGSVADKMDRLLRSRP